MSDVKKVGSFLGTGWKFPPTFDNVNGNVEMVSDAEDIRESLHILLATRLGERLMLPEYGCNMNYLAFNTLDLTTVNFVRKQIRDAITKFEPRIDINKIDINTDDSIDGVLKIEIEFTIRSINTRSNIVYPFYILEGTNVNTGN